jgi:enoyl-CoA hydratase/carnithine racemase
MELLLTGDVVDADEALRLGLLNQVHDDDELADRAFALARRIAAAPPVQVAMITRLVRSAESVDLRTHFDLVSSHFGIVSGLDDYAEAQAAFRERRPGKYVGH